MRIEKINQNLTPPPPHTHTHTHISQQEANDVVDMLAAEIIAVREENAALSRENGGLRERLKEVAAAVEEMLMRAGGEDARGEERRWAEVLAKGVIEAMR